MGIDCDVFKILKKEIKKNIEGCSQEHVKNVTTPSVVGFKYVLTAPSIEKALNSLLAL